jgi:hypothetical protein
MLLLVLVLVIVTENLPTPLHETNAGEKLAPSIDKGAGLAIAVAARVLTDRDATTTRALNRRNLRKFILPHSLMLGEVEADAGAHGRHHTPGPVSVPGIVNQKHYPGSSEVPISSVMWCALAPRSPADYLQQRRDSHGVDIVDDGIPTLTTTTTLAR